MTNFGSDLIRDHTGHQAKSFPLRAFREAARLHNSYHRASASLGASFGGTESEAAKIVCCAKVCALRREKHEAQLQADRRAYENRRSPFYLTDEIPDGAA